MAPDFDWGLVVFHISALNTIAYQNYKLYLLTAPFNLRSLDLPSHELEQTKICEANHYTSP